ncbi:nitrate- and nitrite sensing domain-containing protein [Streptomyces sp. TRM49041]|uniref:sensor histidine kinase n=1 Tax=Streptomyces sp. TRM49041 TaxID=2603216 RepID=UPI0021CC6EC8|nr:nitrate- and nitrite sensing domain-containing protein [Streptomyces sp. TRM49041]
MRLRTLLVLLAVVPTAAMATQVVVTADRLLEQSAHLRSDVAAGERIGLPLYELMTALQAERTATAALWAGPSASAEAVRTRRAATDRAAAEFRRAAGESGAGSEEADRRVREVLEGLDELTTHRDRADSRVGSPDSTVAFYSGVISQTIRFYQDAFSHTDDGELAQESQVVVTMFSASEMLAREDTVLALAGPSRELTTTRFADLVNAVGAHRYLYDRWIVPYLPPEDSDRYSALVGSQAWQAKNRIENHIMSDHKDIAFGVRLPREAAGWPAAHATWAAEVEALNAARTRGLLAHADAKAAALETEVTWLISVSGGALLIVVVVVTATTRSVLRRLRVLHDRTVTVAEQTLPDVVARLQQGRPVDDDALPSVRGDRDEVGRISDAFARVVAVSVDGHRQLAAERHGFGSFATGIASRTGNLVSRQLTLTEELQDSFGSDEALLAQLMRADQLTVGMRRQIENLLILAGGEIPDPHTDPMRVADLLREAAAEVEDFRRIDRQALDEISVDARVISQISHLLAELLDNATRFSPPRSRVIVRAELVADGLSVEVEDRGPRVSAERYAEMNARLHSAPPYAVLAENAHRLGLFVVGHLADQLDATVTLRRSVYGGTSAVVIIPERLLVPTEREEVRRTAARSHIPAQPVSPVVPAPTTPAPAAPAPVSPLPVVPVPAAPPPTDAASGPRGADGGKPELVLHVGSGLPVRPTHERAPDRAQAGAGAARPVARGGDARPALPERVPQTHMAEQLRTARPAGGGTAAQDADSSGGTVRDEASPEEVADAWAEYEDGTRKVEEELRQDQP